MGEVYRARDTTLDRDVALKLLPAEFSTDPDRLARFEREAKTLASLNHPNIAQIYGLESGAAGVRAIVMEFVEGEDLAERLRRGALPIDEALNAVRQVADALDVAHAAGVIHRDLKPGNVKIRPDGVVKVLDFGLAKLARDQSREGAGDSASTMTSPAMTGVGAILGTAAYMAPEQAKGLTVDKRADVWAFGCLLFEMLTGQRLFDADSVSETIAAVLTREPRWTDLPDDTPEPIRRLLRRSVVRDLRQRLSDIGVARLEIDDGLSGAHTSAVPRRRKGLWPVAIGLGILATAIGAVAVNWPRAELHERNLTAGDRLTAPQLSPTGRDLVYVRDEQIVVRSVSTGDEHVVPDSDGAANPFWSYDGTRIAYFRKTETGLELRVVQSRAGERSIQVIPASAGTKGQQVPALLWGGTWCPNGDIVFLQGNGRRMRAVSEDGQDRWFHQSAGSLAYPHCMLDNRILAIRWTTDGYVGDVNQSVPRRETASVVIVSPKQMGTEREHVLLDQSVSERTDVRWPVLVGSEIVFEMTTRTPGLWSFAVTPDVRDRTTEARLVQQDWSHPSTAAGMLTAITGVRVVDSTLVWVNRSGKVLGSFGKAQREFRTPSLSPGAGADRVITGGRRQDASGLWMHTKDQVKKWHDGDPVGETAWSPDSKRIAFVAGSELSVRTVAGDERHVIVRRGARGPNWINNDELVYWSPDDHVWRVQAKEGATPVKIPIENAREASFSLDGKLIAYSSDTTGQLEVFVAPLKDPGSTTQISIGGGRYPRWTDRGLFFTCGRPTDETPGANRALCFATVDLTSGARLGEPTQLFDAAALGFRVIIYSERGYDVTTDGRILVQTAGREGTPSITFIENAKSWLKR